MMVVTHRRWLAPVLSAAAGLAMVCAFFVGTRIARHAPPAAVEARPTVLAVLPFQPFSPDPNNAYFGIGLADSLINNLSRVPGLTVRPMSAALSVVSEHPDTMGAGRALGAAAVLVGRYQQESDRLQVTAQLVDTGTGFTIWAHRFGTTMGDLVHVERDVVEKTLGALLPRLDPAVARRWRSPREPDATARYLFLLARGKIATRTTDTVPDAVRLLERAVAVDPDFAAAHAALSEASADMFLGGLSTDATWIDRALASGKRAVLLDEKDPAGHWGLAYALLFSGDPVGTAREDIRALQLEPDHGPSMRQLAILLVESGASAPARALATRWKALDPSREDGWLEAYLAVSEGRIDDMVRSLTQQLDRRRAIGRSTEYPIVQLGYLAFELGDTVAGLHWAAMLEEASPSLVYPEIIRLLALARAGDLHAVKRVLEGHREVYERDWQYSLWIGRALALAGDTEGALAWLENSARLGSCDLAMLDRSRDLDSLRDHPRFLGVLATVRARATEITGLAALAGYR